MTRQPKTPKWRLLMERIAAQIRDGTYPPTTALPYIRDLVEQGEGSITTVQRAYRELEAEGYVISKKKVGTIVRDRRRIRVPLSRYENLLTSTGGKGPWETATAEQGLDGRMITDTPAAQRVEAPDDVAGHLNLTPESQAVVRRRRALLGDDTVQIQEAWYPLDIARAAGLDRPEKVHGGTLRALVEAGALSPGVVPHTIERVTADTPTEEQAADLAIGARVPLLRVDRVHLNPEGRPIELIRITGTADRLELVYDLPPTEVQPRQDP